MAAEFARAGLWADALDLLGRFVDAPPIPVATPPSAARSSWRSASSPPSRPRRYETLKAWTLPTANRRVVRMLATLGTCEEAPAVFTRSRQGVEAPRSPCQG